MEEKFVHMDSSVYSLLMIFEYVLKGDQRDRKHRDTTYDVQLNTVARQKRSIV